MSKIAANMPVEAPLLQQELRFQLSGLRQDSHADDVFILELPFQDLDLSGVAEALRAQGVDARLADEAVEAMGEFLFGRQLAAHFAKNLRRF